MIDEPIKISDLDDEIFQMWFKKIQDVYQHLHARFILT